MARRESKSRLEELKNKPTLTDEERAEFNRLEEKFEGKDTKVEHPTDDVDIEQAKSDAALGHANVGQSPENEDEDEIKRAQDDALKSGTGRSGVENP